MHVSIKRLQGNLHGIHHLLEAGSFYSLSTGERQALQRGAEDLFRKLSDLQNAFLVLGLLGGTGVGKSTLMNALAGEEIASASHRRPHTDRILIYRHQDASVPVPGLEDLPWEERAHTVQGIRHILLCDLPDFDSIREEHRRRVLAFLERLDLLIWVTSPEKYADGRFYAFLRDTAKAQTNYVFVLNKSDRLFEGDAVDDGYRGLQRLTEGLRGYLKDSGVSDPVIYPLSAGEALARRASPWNQFPAFKQHLFQHRDKKQIQAIKASNLDVEVQRLLEQLQGERRNLDTFCAILRDVAAGLEANEADWQRTGRRIIGGEVERRIPKGLFDQREDPTPLIGPGLALMLLLQSFSSAARRDNPPASLVADTLPKGIAALFRRRLEGIETSLERRLLSHNLPSPFRDKVSGTLRTAARTERLTERMSQSAALLAADPPLPSFPGLKILQWTTYSLLLVLFLFAIGGNSWHNLLTDTGFKGILGLLVTMVQNLFSSKGLAALLSYALLNLFFAIRFHLRYRRGIHRSMERFRTSTAEVLETLWEEERKRLFSDLNGLTAEAEKQRAFLNALSPGEDRE